MEIQSNPGHLGTLADSITDSTTRRARVENDGFTNTGWPGLRVNSLMHIRVGALWVPVGAAFPIPVNLAGPANASDLSVETVTVAASGTAQTGPNVTIPEGFSVVVRYRVTNAGGTTGYVGRAADAGPGLAAGDRIELALGASISLRITNMDILAFDASANGVVFELYAEA